jgi:hypothetical protein
MNTPDHADEAIRGVTDAGIRAVFAHCAPSLGRDEWFGAENSNRAPWAHSARPSEVSTPPGLLADDTT